MASGHMLLFDTAFVELSAVYDGHNSNISVKSNMNTFFFISEED